MSLNILETFSSAFGGPLVRQLSSSLDEPEQSMRSAIQSLGPTLLAGLMQQTTKPSGAADLYRAISDERVDEGIVGKLSSLFGNRGSLDALSQVGEALGPAVLGSRGGAVVNALSSVSGIQSGSALRLLSIALPVIFGIVRKYMNQNSLGASGLAPLLLDQRRSLEKAGLDSRITNAMGYNNLSGLLDGLPHDVNTARPGYQPERAPVHKRSNRKSWLPWAIAAGVAALALVIWNNRPDGRAPRVAASPAGSADRTTLEPPSTSVYFDTGEVVLSDDDRRKILRVAEAVKGEPRPVAITGYTDRTGNAEQNMEIAKDRAGAVRDALVAEGVAETQIVMDPPAVVTGTGTDQEARRVDIKVR